MCRIYRGQMQVTRHAHTARERLALQPPARFSASLCWVHERKIRITFVPPTATLSLLALVCGQVSNVDLFLLCVYIVCRAPHTP